MLLPLGISQSRLASDLGVPFRRVHEWVHGRRGITAESALLLGHYFGMSPEFWMNHQAQHDLELARATMGPKLQAVRARPPLPLAEA